MYQNELYKTCFQHDMAYRQFYKNSFCKILGDKAFNIAKNLKYDGYQRGLVWVVYKFFGKKALVEKLKMKLYLLKN